jgi:hypothetical protein
MTGSGHEDAFPPPRLSVRCRFSQGTFAGTRRNGRDAPTLDVPPFDARIGFPDRHALPRITPMNVPTVSCTALPPEPGSFIGPKASFKTSPADARGGGKRLFILDFHQLTADVERRLCLCSDAVSNEEPVYPLPCSSARVWCIFPRLVAPGGHNSVPRCKVSITLHTNGRK